MTRVWPAVVLSLLLSSCAATSPYAVDYPLSKEAFRSRDGLFSGWIPQGWFSSTDDSLAPALAVWLLRDDFAAGVSVKELHIDPSTASRIDQGGLKLLALASAGLHPDIPATPAVEPKEFDLKGRTFCGYEYSGEGKLGRVVVFTARGRYFECEARPLKGRWTPADAARLYSVQQTMLSGLTF